MHKPYSGADMRSDGALNFPEPAPGSEVTASSPMVDRVTHLSASGVTVRAAQAGEQRLTAQL